MAASLALLLLTVPISETEVWRGRLTYPGCTTNVPLEIRVDTTTGVAGANWTFQNCDGGHCGQGAAGGNVTLGGAGRAANNWTAQGGWGPTAGPLSHGGLFYSLTGILSADKTQLTAGEVYRGGPTEHWTSDGTWHATKGAAPVTNFTCVPPKPLPWASCEAPSKTWKPPNATKTTRPLIWPLPKAYTNGSMALQVVPGASFFKLSGGQTSKLLVRLSIDFHCLRLFCDCFATDVALI